MADFKTRPHHMDLLIWYLYCPSLEIQFSLYFNLFGNRIKSKVKKSVFMVLNMIYYYYNLTK